MKQWARVHADAFRQILGSRYIMYGEWVYAKHTVFYDALPHYFLEFDVLDRQMGSFLDTPSRRALLDGAPVVSVPVLAEGTFTNKYEVMRLLGKSRYITDSSREALLKAAEELGLDPERACDETDLSGMMEGLYFKIEEDGRVVERMKYVRAEFLQCVDLSDSHWLDRPIIPNQLAVSAKTLYEPSIGG